MSDYEDIKSRIKISSVVSEYLSLKPIGRDRFQAICPFHGEKTPSFNVDDSRKFFKCFGCGQSGDVIDFVEKIEGISHLDAVKRLKIEAGIEDSFLTPSQKKVAEAQKKSRMQLLDRCRKWKSSLVSDLITYTNAQWKIHRVSARQMRDTPTEELEKQYADSMAEAISREKALVELESMSDSVLLEWYSTVKSWLGVKNPRWVLSGWRKEMTARSSQ